MRNKVTKNYPLHKFGFPYAKGKVVAHQDGKYVETEEEAIVKIDGMLDEKFEQPRYKSGKKEGQIRMPAGMRLNVSGDSEHGLLNVLVTFVLLMQQR